MHVRAAEEEEVGHKRHVGAASKAQTFTRECPYKSLESVNSRGHFFFVFP